MCLYVAPLQLIITGVSLSVPQGVLSEGEACGRLNRCYASNCPAHVFAPSSAWAALSAIKSPADVEECFRES